MKKYYIEDEMSSDIYAAWMAFGMLLGALAGTGIWFAIRPYVFAWLGTRGLS